MAYLSTPNTHYRIFLKAFHKFGRLSTAVDTVVNSPEISRLHALIEWDGNHWHLRDLSKNGVWVNGQPITPNQLYPLGKGDHISFSHQHNTTFIAENIDPPRDLLIPFLKEDTRTADDVEPILLENYHFLPSEESPETIVFYDAKEHCWMCETLAGGNPFKLSDGELLEFSHRQWQLLKGAANEAQETVAISENPHTEFCYIFNISPDEELTELTVMNRSRSFNCEARSHHYLTALLARYKGEDLKNQIPESQQGWRSVEQLTKDIGLSETHVNIQIHRARKQLSDLLQSEGMVPPLLIERKRGRVRLAVKDYQVIKGNNLEVDSRQLM